MEIGIGARHCRSATAFSPSTPPRRRRRAPRSTRATRAAPPPRAVLALVRLKRRLGRARASGDEPRRPKRQTSPRKANRRGAARLAAVQALYQMDMAGAGLNEILAQFESHWLGREVEGEQYLPAEAGVLPRHRGRRGRRRSATSIRGSTRRSPPTWPLKRIEAILRSVLRAGACELAKAHRHSGARDRVGICRRRPCLRRPDRDRHGQCRARSTRPAVAARRIRRDVMRQSPH